MISRILSFARGVERRRVRVSGKEIISELGAVVRDTFPKQSPVRPTSRTIYGLSLEFHTAPSNPTQSLRQCTQHHAEGRENLYLHLQFRIDEPYTKTHLEPASPYICIEVEDTGEGISKEIIGKI